MGLSSLQPELSKIEKPGRKKIGNEWTFHLNRRSIDYHFEELGMLLDTFCENRLSNICCSLTWMTESSVTCAYSLESYAPTKFEPA